MVSFILSVLFLVAIGYGGIKVGQYAATKTASVDRLKKHSKIIGSATAPAAAFLIFAVLLPVFAPAPSEFGVANVNWETRNGGVLGSTSDAILVRTTGAEVHPGYLYSTARLSGQTYVGLPTAQWIAADHPAVASTIFYGVIALLMGGLTVALAAVEPRLKAWFAVKQAPKATPAPAAVAAA